MEVSRTFEALASGYAVAEIEAEGLVRIVNADGGQVGDLFAFVAGKTSEYASAPHTRSITRRLFPSEGEFIFSSERRPMLQLVTDSSQGRHDTLYAACDPKRYEMLGALPDHRTCATNLEEAMAAFGGLGMPTPQPFNLFMEVHVSENGGLEVTPSTAAPGDFVLFKAIEDIIIVLSACPMDVYEISSGGLSPLRIELLERE